MQRTVVSQLTQRASRTLCPQLKSAVIPKPFLANRTAAQTLQIPRRNFNQPRRSLSTNRAFQKGLSPETDNPQSEEAKSGVIKSSTSRIEISVQRFHELSDSYLGMLLDRLEALQEEREDVDVEYSSGVLNLKFPPNGEYVLNKQPPNKQIWLSSPITGPKRFDFVMVSEGQDAKQGTGAEDWVYLRDGSTLNDILLKEVGVDMREAWTPELDTRK